MKTICTLFLLGSLARSAQAQDLSVVDVSSPVSRCALTPTETVTISYLNAGPELAAGTRFSVSYQVNGDAAVSETVTLATALPTNASGSYTFSKQPDLSASGVYVFDLSASLPGDINHANDALRGYTVENNMPSVGGSVVNRDGLLMLANSVGVVEQWERSLDHGRSWQRVAATPSIDFSFALAARYRARVRNGSCPQAFSSEFQR